MLNVVPKEQNTAVKMFCVFYFMAARSAIFFFIEQRLSSNLWMQFGVQTFQCSRGCRELRNFKLSAESWLQRSVWELFPPLKRTRFSSPTCSQTVLIPNLQRRLSKVSGSLSQDGGACARQWRPAELSPVKLTGGTATQIYLPGDNIQWSNNIRPRTFLFKKGSAGHLI